MYDDDVSHTFVLAAASTGVLGLSEWLPRTILAILIAVVLVTLILRIRRHRSNR